MTTQGPRAPLAATSSTADEVADALGDSWTSDRDLFADSPFLALKQMNSRAKGAKFEQLAAWYLDSQGYRVTRADSSNYDRRVDDERVEIKGSFLWSDGSMFRWQQIRLDQDYDHLIFLAVYPDRAEYYTCTHAEASAALRRRDAQGFLPHNQHGGKRVDSGTFYVEGLPEDISWFKPLGGGFPAPVATTLRP
jgi:hypothetical protein